MREILDKINYALHTLKNVEDDEHAKKEAIIALTHAKDELHHSRINYTYVNAAGKTCHDTTLLENAHRKLGSVLTELYKLKSKQL